MKYVIPMLVWVVSLPALAQSGQEPGEGKDARAMHAVDREKHEKPPGPSKKDRIMNLLLARELLLQRYGANGGGVLDEEEKKILLKDAEKAREEARKRFFSQFDKNGDGKLSREEVQQMREFLKERRPPNPDGADMVLPPPPRGRKPGDGEQPKADGPEKAVHGVVRQMGKEKFIVRPSVFMLLQKLIMERYDRNDNGRIDPDEHRQLKKDAEAIYRKKCDDLLALYDKNGDGKLDNGEKASVIADRDGRQEDEALRKIEFDDIDRFIKNSFEEELMDMLEEDGAGAGKESNDTGK